MINRYMRKQTPVKAVQWTGNNLEEIEGLFEGVFPEKCHDPQYDLSFCENEKIVRIFDNFLDRFYYINLGDFLIIKEYEEFFCFIIVPEKEFYQNMI